jgi:dethiobiotin synthetase
VTAIFVTATGTDIGKTFVTAGLIRHFRNAGRGVAAIKPVVSGFDLAVAEASDPGRLLSALGRQVVMAEIERIAPWRFAAPLSPDLAAAREGRHIDFRALLDFCSSAAIPARRDMLLIEGVGGVMVPLDDRHTVLDWMTALQLPVLLVAGSYLGTISHTLTALHVIAQRKLDIAGVVISESEGPAPPLDDTVATIARFVGPIEIVALPRLAPDAMDHPVFARIAQWLE